MYNYCNEVIKMSEKRFEVVLNEFDEVEYIMDKKLCEDKDFAEFMDFVEELAKENEQLRKELKNRSAFIIDKGLGDTFVRWKNE